MWRLADELRDGVRAEDAMPLLLLLLAIMSKAACLRVAAGDQMPSRTTSSAHFAPLPTRCSRSPTRSCLPAQLPAQSVARAITTLSDLDRLELGSWPTPCLEQAAKALGHRGGEFLTSAVGPELVVAHRRADRDGLQPGDGGRAADGRRRRIRDLDARSLRRPRDRPRIWAMAQLNLAVHDVAADVALGDVFSEDRFPQLRADRVISVPPWGRSCRSLTRSPTTHAGCGVSQARTMATRHGSSTASPGSPIDGRAVIVLPNAALFEGGRAGRIRQRIVKAGLLDAVFALPPGLFAWTALPCSVLVFTKGRAERRRQAGIDSHGRPHRINGRGWRALRHLGRQPHR